MLLLKEYLTMKKFFLNFVHNKRLAGHCFAAKQA